MEYCGGQIVVIFFDFLEKTMNYDQSKMKIHCIVVKFQYTFFE